MEIKSKKPVFAFIDGLLSNRLAFSIIYLITAIMLSFPILGSIAAYPMKLLFVIGIVFLFYDFFTKRTMFTGYKSFWLVLFTLSYVITVILNTDQLSDGAKHLIHNSIFLFLIYPFDLKIDPKKVKKAFVILHDIIIIITFIASLVAIAMFALRFDYMFTKGDALFVIGISYNRLNGIYTSANTAALFTVLSICLSFITRFLNKDHFNKFKWFYITNIVIQFLSYSATLSKGGLLAYVAAIFGAFIIFGFPYFLKKFKPIVSAFLVMLLIGGSILTLQGATFVSRKVMLFLPKAVSYIASGGQISENPEDELILERVETDGDVTNGRTTIWSAGFALLKENPVFGKADGDVYEGDTLIAHIDESQLTDNNISELKRAGGYMHNAIVQILVYSGIAGMGIIALFAFFIAKKCIKALLRYHGTKTYSLLGSALILLVVLISQFLAESHLLFNRQDPFAIIFWLYWGYSMFIIKKADETNADGAAFVCGTPYQVVNAINLSSIEEKSDIYIYNEFNNAEKVANNLKELNIFSNVIFANKYKSFPGIVNKFSILLIDFFPLRTLKKYCSAPLPRGNYKRIYVSNVTSFSDSIKLLSPYAEAIQYEDGIGSYHIESFEKYFRTGIFKLANRFLLNGRLSYNSKVIYLNHPKCYQGSAYDEVRAMPKFENVDILAKVFDYKNSPYKDSKYIYITQPLYETSAGKQSVDIEKDILEAVKDNVIIRIHPRQSEEEYSGYQIDKTRNLWELECAKQIDDSHILIGAFSTAQFTPKMLYGKEPTVIFTYKLYGEGLNIPTETIEMLKNMYKEPEKVIIVETAQDLQNILKSIGENGL